MTVISALKMLKPLVRVFDHNRYHPPTLAQKRAAHMKQAVEAKDFNVYNGSSLFPKVEKIDLPPLTFMAGDREWTSYAIRPKHYTPDSLKPGDRVVFGEGRNGVKRLHMIYDHRLFLDTLQPMPLLRAVALGDQHYTGGLGHWGLYKDDWSTELLKPAPAKAALTLKA